MVLGMSTQHSGSPTWICAGFSNQVTQIHELTYSQGGNELFNAMHHLIHSARHSIYQWNLPGINLPTTTTTTI
jgi:hypothetical protein